MSLAPAPADVAVSVAAAGNDAGDDDDDADRDGSDEKSATQQLRGQLTSLLLLGGAWLSAVGVVGRPLRAWLPYDELLCSLAYALCSAALGLHVLLFHLLSRRDVVLACGAAPKPYRRPRNKPPAAHTTAATTTTITPSGIFEIIGRQQRVSKLTLLTTSAPAEPALQENAARDKAPDSAHPTLPPLPALPAHPVHPPVVDPMVEVLDAATQLVNSFYDPRQVSDPSSLSWIPRDCVRFFCVFFFIGRAPLLIILLDFRTAEQDGAALLPETKTAQPDGGAQQPPRPRLPRPPQVTSSTE